MDPRIPNSLRFLSIDAIQKAKSGHPGMPMGMADVATILFTEFLKFDPKKPSWADRDRFVLSNGHGSMLLYSLLYLLGVYRRQNKTLENASPILLSAVTTLRLCRQILQILCRPVGRVLRSDGFLLLYMCLNVRDNLLTFHWITHLLNQSLDLDYIISSLGE